jgi:hypothetical protein
MDRLSVQTLIRDGNSLYRFLSILLEDEFQYNRLRQKAVEYVCVVSEGQVIHKPTTILLVKLRVTEVYVFYTFLANTITR